MSKVRSKLPKFEFVVGDRNGVWCTLPNKQTDRHNNKEAIFAGQTMSFKLVVELKRFAWSNKGQIGASFLANGLHAF